MIQKRSLPQIFCTDVILALDIILLITAFFGFQESYVFNAEGTMPVAEGYYAFSRKIFLLDFYVFFSLFAIFLAVFLFNKRRRYIVLSLLVTVVSADLCLYTGSDLFSIKIYIFIAWIITVSVRLELKYSSVTLICGIISFVLMQFQPSILGIVDMRGNPVIKNGYDFFMIVSVLVITAAFFCMYRFIVYKWQESESTKRHLNMVMSQMTVINQELQDYAKNKGQKAAEEERLRITRDMHDSCGYVFVNIISLMQACVSSPPVDWSRTTEIFEMVRNLASQGLQETRQTLRAIRDIQSPVENNLDSLYQIKSIFQKVTGIEVILDKGNIKSDYGRTINKILIRVMQESLTNSVKHGHASLVCVYFRDDGDFLYMTVKDNGIGSKQIVKGIGFAGMEERLKPVGGEIEAGISAEGGFQLDVKIPLVQILMEEHE
ncbi:MAG: hypothetical protein K6G00_12545 [Treponema sp.]|nr:hypothetical protein [Treponema sp.]